MVHHERLQLRPVPLCLCLGLLIGCSQGERVAIVTVNGHVDMADRIRVYPMLDQKLALEPLELPIPVESPFSFGLQFSGAAGSKFSVTVGAYGADGCLLADGADHKEIADAPLDLRLSLSTLALLDQVKPLPGAPPTKSPDCYDPGPYTLENFWSESDGHPHFGGLTITGWGFGTGTTVRIDGQEQCIELVSYREIDIPSPSVAPRPRTAELSVSIPGKYNSYPRNDLEIPVISPINRMWHPLFSTEYLPANPILDIASGQFDTGYPIDLATINTLGEVSIYQDNGEDFFDEMKTSILTNSPGISHITRANMHSADIDNDQKTDLIIISDAGITSLLQTEAWQMKVAWQDWTSRGRDIVAAKTELGNALPKLIVAGDQIEIYDNLGNGKFIKSPTTIPIAADAIEIADFDGDQRPDLAVVESPPSTYVDILLGADNFSSSDRYDLRRCDASTPPVLVIGDFDQNGYPDIALNGSRRYLMNRVKGSFSDRTFSNGFIASSGSSDACSGGISMLAVDINRDSSPDLVRLTMDGIFALLNDGTGGFSFVDTYPYGTPSSFPLGQAPSLGRGYFAAPGPRHLFAADLLGRGQWLDIIVGADSLRVTAAPPYRPCAP